MTALPVIVRELRAQAGANLSTHWLRIAAAAAALAVFGHVLLATPPRF